MKYKILFNFLKVLIYIKRGIWWLGQKSLNGLLRVGFAIWGVVGFIIYKIKYTWKKSDIKDFGSWIFKRTTLQAFVFIMLFFFAFPQTKLSTQKDNVIPGKNTLAYELSEPNQEFALEEVAAEEIYIPIEVSSWKQGAVIADMVLGLGGDLSAIHEKDLAGVVAGGSAISKPIILPGGQTETPTQTQTPKRNTVINYIVKGGDSIGSIADKFGISLLTLLWENNLTSRSVLQPGQSLKIPPTSGVMHTIKSGDTILKIANLYGVKPADIISFNGLSAGGANIQIGQKLMVPNGVKKIYTSPTTQSGGLTYKTSESSVSVNSIPKGSKESGGSSGYVWPSSATIITQYYNWKHHGLDIAGPWQSAIYAARGGTVEKAQCGWNSGYGCYIIINHGGGVKTLYGHNSKLLVSPGDEVVRGQTISLMGNTGKVYGRTGIHLHFEVQINGVRVNPLGYIK